MDTFKQQCSNSSLALVVYQVFYQGHCEMQEVHDHGRLSPRVQTSYEAEGAFLDSSKGAARFAALVRCSVEEAHLWLRGATGSMEAALDSYLAQKTTAKRPKTCAVSSPSCTLPRSTLGTPEAVCLSKPPGRTLSSQGLPRPGKTRSRSLSEKDSFGSEAADAGVLLIDLAEDSDQDGTLKSDSAIASSHHAACGKTRISGGYRSEFDAVAGCLDFVSAFFLVSHNPCLCNKWQTECFGAPVHTDEKDKKGSSTAEKKISSSVEGSSPLALEHLPEDFTFFLGKCVASGTVTSGTITRLSLTVRLWCCRGTPWR